MANQLLFKRLSDRAFTPLKASPQSAGFDLKSAHSLTILPNHVGLVETDLRIKVPNGTYGRIAPRSGLALYRMINVLGGVIDADYRGNVGVILMNHGSDTFFIERGDRVAQLILEKISYANLVEVEILDSTNRGWDGFGSSGLNSFATKYWNITIVDGLEVQDDESFHNLELLLKYNPETIWFSGLCFRAEYFRGFLFKQENKYTWKVQVGFDHPLNEQRCLERIDAHDGSFGEPDTNRTCSGSEQLERTQDLLFNFTYGQEVDPVPFRTSVIKYKETQSNLSLSKCKENFVSPD